MSAETSGGPAATEEQRRELSRVVIPAVQRLIASGVPFAEITMSRLLAEAGVTRYRFYSRFRDKLDLLNVWFLELNETSAQDHEAWLSIDERPDPAALRDAIAALFVPYEPFSTLHAALYDAATVDPRIAAEIGSIESVRTAALCAHIRRGQRDGWIRPAIHPQETAEWIVATGSRTYQRMLVATGELSTAEFVDLYAEFVWGVLYADGAPSDGDRP